MQKSTHAGSIEVKHGGSKQRTATSPEMVKKVILHKATDDPKKDRLERAKELKRRHAPGDFPHTIFSGEKVSTVQADADKQNDQAYLTEVPLVTVWAAVNADFRSLFVDEGVKINAALYREQDLEAVLKPWTRQEYGNTPYTFQQDSAPAHKARVNQEWLRDNIPHFISAAEWPPSSPDANPLHYSVWSILSRKVCTN